MSTQKTDTQQNTYDPTSMGTMQAMLGPGTGGGGGFGPGAGFGGPQGAPGGMGGGKFGGGQPSFMQFPGGGQQGGQQGGGLGNVTANYINNPFGNPFFQTQQQMGTRQAQNLGGTQMSDLLRNMMSSGMAGGASSPAGLELQQNQGRANTGLQSQLGFLNPVQNALGMQQGAMQLAAGFRPLQTGGKQTETTSGTGTWLPQLAGAALGGLTGMGGLGGLTSLFGGHGGSGPMNYSGANSGPTSFTPNGPGSAWPSSFGGDPFGGQMPGGGMAGGPMGQMGGLGGYGGINPMMTGGQVPSMFGVG
jgi:hypothetical protein